MQFLSTPSARRATNVPPASIDTTMKISIHALREEGDAVAADKVAHVFIISIHALREEGDSGRRRWLSMPYNFYPRPPRGGRHAPSGSVPFSAEFLSTPSARRATHSPCSSPADLGYFYPRPPRGGRQNRLEDRAFWENFYPRPPRGGRPSCLTSGIPSC